MMESAERYEKELSRFTLEYMPARIDQFTGQPFELQVSLGAMDLEDAFRITLQPEDAGYSIGELLDKLFPRDEPARNGLRATLDIVENPDLPAMYNALLDIFRDWKEGVYALRFFANHGTEMSLSETVSDHLSLRSVGVEGDAAPLLDLVIEVRYRSLSFLAERGYCGSKEELLRWLQIGTLLYFLDKHEYRLGLSPANESDRRLLPVAEQLEREGVIAPSDETESFRITGRGRQVIAMMIAEAESYIDRFDLFSDVLYDAETELVEFSTGHGEDLRTEVYEAEGLDPVRAVFLLRLYDGTLDEYAVSWREAIDDEQLFNDLLSPVVDRVRVDDALIRWIIERGYARNDQRDEAARELRARRDILNRARAFQPLTDETIHRD